MPRGASWHTARNAERRSRKTLRFARPAVRHKPRKILGWITGLIFFFIDKRPYVRFHATQSIVVFGALTILSEILSNVFGFSFLAGGVTGFSLGFALWRLLHLLGVILWLLLIIKAYQGERFRIPIAADLADKIFGKS
jgi:uncharacterized membrane protein